MIAWRLLCQNTGGVMKCDAALPIAPTGADTADFQIALPDEDIADNRGRTTAPQFQIGSRHCGHVTGCRRISGNALAAAEIV